MLGILGTVTSFLGKSQLATGAMLAAMLGMAGYIGLLKFEDWRNERKIADLETQVMQLENRVEKKELEVQSCKNQVSLMNDRLEDLSQDSQARNKVIEILADNIGTFRELSNERIGDIRNAPTPESCAAAMDFLRKGLGE